MSDRLQSWLAEEVALLLRARPEATEQEVDDYLNQLTDTYCPLSRSPRSDKDHDRLVHL